MRRLIASIVCLSLAVSAAAGGDASFPRSIITEYEKHDGVITFNIFNGTAKYLYKNLEVSERKGKTYLDKNCDSKKDYKGVVTIKEGHNIVCYRYQSCDGGLYFCEQKINAFTGQSLELRAQDI